MSLLVGRVIQKHIIWSKAKSRVYKFSFFLKNIYETSRWIKLKETWTCEHNFWDLNVHLHNLISLYEKNLLAYFLATFLVPHVKLLSEEQSAAFTRCYRSVWSFTNFFIVIPKKMKISGFIALFHKPRTIVKILRNQHISPFQADDVRRKRQILRSLSGMDGSFLHRFKYVWAS